MQTIFTRPDYTQSALITIDVQRDFLDDGLSAIPGTSAALPAMQAVLSAYREAGKPILHVVRLYQRDGSNMDLCRRHLAAERRVPVESGAPGSQLAPGLVNAAVTIDSASLLDGQLQPVSDLERLMYKPRWGAFYGTSLQQHLEHLRVSTLVFIGCNFPNCPRTSMYEASERDFRVVAVRDAISGIYARGVAELENIGVSVVRAEDIVRAMRREPARTAPSDLP